jgi:hypothetical protein
MEYKSGAVPRLNYDEEMGAIVKEHLVSENKNPLDKTSMIGSGDYEGFLWQKGNWIFVSEIFGEATREIPVPQPLKESSQLPE